MTVTYGDVTLTAIHAPDGHLEAVRCDHADPRVGISPVLLAQWHVEESEWIRRIVTLRCADTCPVGDVITFNCINRRLVYRVTGTEPGWLEGSEPYAYVAEWPD